MYEIVLWLLVTEVLPALSNVVQSTYKIYNLTVIQCSIDLTITFIV